MEQVWFLTVRFFRCDNYLDFDNPGESRLYAQLAFRTVEEAETCVRNTIMLCLGVQYDASVDMDTLTKALCERFPTISFEIEAMDVTKNTGAVRLVTKK